jgi:hypothetical protein
LENQKADRSLVEISLEEISLWQKKIIAQIHQKENSIYTIENFIEKYLPVRVLSQISDIMLKIYSDESSQECKRLLNYEKRMYRQYNTLILNDSGKPDLL